MRSIIILLTVILLISTAQAAPSDAIHLDLNPEERRLVEISINKIYKDILPIEYYNMLKTGKAEDGALVCGTLSTKKGKKKVLYIFVGFLGITKNNKLHFAFFDAMVYSTIGPFYKECEREGIAP